MTRSFGYPFLLFLPSAFCLLPTSSRAADGDAPIPIVEVKLSGPIKYSEQVAPILEAKCVDCHNEAFREGKLSLEDPAHILKGGKRGPAIVPGKGAESLLIKLAGHAMKPFMPPANKKGVTLGLAGQSHTARRIRGQSAVPRQAR